MKKRGQITVFIILAVILIGGIIVLFSINNKSQNISGFETGNVETFILDCIKETGTDVAYRVGDGGGYYFPPNFSTASGIAYYYSDGKNYMPSKKDIEKEISYYTAKELFFCTKNFVDFSDFNITQGEITVNTSIKEKEIVFDVNYQLSISKGVNTKLLEKFNKVTVPIRFGILYDSAEQIVNEEIQSDAVCLTCLANVSLKNDFFVHMFDYKNDSVIFIFRDEKFPVESNVFKLTFANKYKLAKNKYEIQ